ncbi:MAG: 2-oxoacid:ferredoxin oxidoreductase subunit gamma [Candidatus Aminicenantes bacterium]|nr:2-oxoacid:ferredoxin oxidoreductase subunit gamma [Candidatus Aminicenantes bacterium]
MLKEMVFAGFGGQGVLSLGTLLAYGAMKEGKEVSWFPSYGPEMRGGTANCMVNISDEKISSPIDTEFDIAVVFNKPSLEKFEPRVKKDGILIWESSTIDKGPTRKDIRAYAVPAIKIASEKLENTKVMNMIAMGALVKVSQIIKTESVHTALKETLPQRYHHLLPLNKKALKMGMDLVEKK